MHPHNNCILTNAFTLLHPCVTSIYIQLRYNVRTHSHLCFHTNTSMHSHPFICIRTCIHAFPSIQVHPHTCIHVHFHPLRCIHTHAPMHFHPFRCIRPHVSMHLQPFRCIHTHASMHCHPSLQRPPYRLHDAKTDLLQRLPALSMSNKKLFQQNCARLRQLKKSPMKLSN